MRSGSSRLDVVTSISAGASSASNAIWVPQRGQKLRVPLAEERNRVGSPASHRNSGRSTLNQATNGAPVVRRQIEQ
jgi:hypothetical protein